jgi:hypothetical protein
VSSPADEAIIVSAELGPAHDGIAEAVIGIRFDNGAVRHVTVGSDHIEPALTATGATSLSGLVGQPWSVLLPE